jgi:C4-dicarboxylate-specific signal transduction histidine kinase
MNFSRLLPDSIKQAHVLGFTAAVEAGSLHLENRSLQGPGLKKDGTEFFAESAFGLVRKNKEILFTVVMRDITERRLIEQEAMRSAQLASLGELAAGVAHEINNPIMGVINYAQIILNRSGAAGGGSELPQRIISEAERVAKIVNNLLGFAREATETAAPAQLRPVVEAAVALMRKTVLQSGATVTVAIGAGLPRAVMQPQKIQQVFINLLSNALYALNQKYPEPHAEKIVTITGEEIHEAAGFFIRTTVQDTGSGIPQAIMHKICNPFFTTKPVGMGTGLGLSISHNIIKEHGGRLLFESRQGQCTKVMVDLPMEEK